MMRNAISMAVVGILQLFYGSFAYAAESPKTLDTCATQLVSAPLNLNSLFLLGDSITNASTFKRKMMAGVEIRDMIYSGQKTVSGIGIGQAIDLLDAEIDHSEIAAADIVFTNLGVNNWGQAITNMSSLESLVDTFIEDIKSINSDIIILWQEPYGHAPLVSNPNIAVGAALLAEYLRSKDAIGKICLIPWGDLAAADPIAYTTATFPDGVHIWGNESIYQNITFDYIDSLRGNIHLIRK